MTWARSSAGEHYVDIVGVTGSIPVAPTISFPQKSAPDRCQHVTGIGAFLDIGQQRAWARGKARLVDAAERLEQPEQRLKYLARFEKLQRMPQARAVFDLIGRYGRDFIPVPRRTERYWWSVSCLPATPGKALIRVNASWMELFAIHADGADVSGKFLVHLSDFTTDHSPQRESVDQVFLERSVATAEDVSTFFPRGDDMFGIKVHGMRSIGKFLRSPRVQQAIRAFNLTHMNRGRNAYQASHCPSLADHMVGE